MESFYWYKGYGIRYDDITGTTRVEYCGIPLRVYKKRGKTTGDKKAKKYIDELVKYKEKL